MHKIETHLHTVHSSSCGHLDATFIAENYAKAGYHGIVVTDHFNQYNFRKHEWPEKKEAFSIHAFLEGYYRLVEAAKPYGIKVYKGAEVRFAGSSNDYLLYNYPNSLLEDPEVFFSMGLAAFYEQCQKVNALIIQAHPCRDKCEPANPLHLDGIEVQNMHPRQDNRNHLALAFANENPHLIQLCGSDCHQEPDIALGGILTETLPSDETALAAILRSGNFQLI